MKVFVTLALLAAVAYAEPPLYRQQQQNRYFIARQQEETTESGPYSPRGWRPDGPAFNLPQRQQKQQQVENAYGPPQQPQQQYGPPQQPQQQYGPPQQPQQQPGPSQQLQQQHGPPQQPQQQYGPPQQPQQQYGAPESQAESVSRQNLPTLKIQAFARQQQQQQQPQQHYGAPQQLQQQYGAPQQPQQQYGAPPQPQQQYGAPEYTTTEFSSVTEIDEPTTDNGLSESESEQSNLTNEFEEDADVDGQSQKPQQSQQQQQERGEYYVALPDGRLQRVRYVSRQDLEAMRYFAKIRAENVEPLRGPIYAYAPLQKLQVAPGNLQVEVAAAPVVPTVSIGAPEAKPQKLVQSPKVDIKPLAQVQIQHDTPAQVVPLSSSYTTYTANYQAPAAEERYILAFP